MACVQSRTVSVCVDWGREGLNDMYVGVEKGSGVGRGVYIDLIEEMKARHTTSGYVGDGLRPM